MMNFIKDENGQGMLEYVLIIALVAIAIIAILVAVRNKVKEQDLEGQLDSALSTEANG